MLEYIRKVGECDAGIDLFGMRTVTVKYPNYAPENESGSALTALVDFSIG